jgi:hypothetical protein
MKLGLIVVGGGFSIRDILSRRDELDNKILNLKYRREPALTIHTNYRLPLSLLQAILRASSFSPCYHLEVLRLSTARSQACRRKIRFFQAQRKAPRLYRRTRYGRFFALTVCDRMTSSRSITPLLMRSRNRGERQIQRVGKERRNGLDTTS